MSVIRSFWPQNRLRDFVAEPGGMPIAEAVARADLRVEEIRERCLDGIGEKIAAIARAAEREDVSALDQCYVLANEIYAEAGFFGLSELSAAALNLCVLLSGADYETIPAEAVRVHVRAMHALRHHDVAESAEKRAAVLTELRALAAHFASLESARQP